MNVNDAVKTAIAYYSSFSVANPKISVEEIEFNDTDKLWLITLGITEANPYMIANSGKVDKFKEFTINAETGNVESMKIRTI